MFKTDAYFMETIKISLDKTRAVRNLAGAVLFVVLGILFIWKPFWFIRSDNPSMIRTIGYICIAFFGILAAFLAKTVANNKDGFFIDEEGIIDRSSGVSVGRVFWKDIKAVRVEPVSGQHFIMLDVKNPQEYIRRQQNPLKKRTMEMNYQVHKTPVSITSHFLRIEFEKLESLIRSGLEKAKSK